MSSAEGECVKKSAPARVKTAGRLEPPAPHLVRGPRVARRRRQNFPFLGNLLSKVPFRPDTPEHRSDMLFRRRGR